MLHESNQIESTGSKSLSHCRPDYEQMILRLRQKVSKTIVFRDAALEYFEGRCAKNKMAELIGELVTECAAHELEIAALIKQQEKDGKE